MYVCDDGLVEIETCRGNVTNDYLLFNVQFVGLNPV
jgi:hypothetical protein